MNAIDDMWFKKEHRARLNTIDFLNGDLKKALVVIKAQHPLTQKGLPGSEYEARLNKALKIIQDCAKRDLRIRILVFGGVHDQSGVSLAVAGKKHLLEHGVKEEIICYDNAFCGNDEDDLAYQDLLTQPVSEIHVILSLAQIFRSSMRWIDNGIIPIFHPITYNQDPYHSVIKELRAPEGVLSFFEP